MVSVLLVFSLLLHFVTFYILIVLIQRINHLKSKTNEEAMSDLNKLLQAHLDTVREENQALIAKIDKNRSQQITPIRKSESVDVHTNLKDKKVKLEEEPLPSYTPSVEDVVDKLESSSTAQVLHLYEKGLKESDIAKELNLGKGEVELMINLNKKRRK